MSFRAASSRFALGLLLLHFAGGPFMLQDVQCQEPAKVANKLTTTTILQADELKVILPPSVFFQGQSAPLQLRNSSGIRFTDGAHVLACLVDSSGYASSVKEKYQAYFITERVLQFGSQKLIPGAYGVGFLADHTFLVMDISGHTVLTAPTVHDEVLKHPTPLHIEADSTEGAYRLYEGRTYVVFHSIVNGQ